MIITYNFIVLGLKPFWCTRNEVMYSFSWLFFVQAALLLGHVALAMLPPRALPD